jgi:hypothetical protein
MHKNQDDTEGGKRHPVSSAPNIDLSGLRDWGLLPPCLLILFRDAFDDFPDFNTEHVASVSGSGVS